MHVYHCLIKHTDHDNDLKHQGNDYQKHNFLDVSTNMIRIRSSEENIHLDIETLVRVKSPIQGSN